MNALTPMNRGVRPEAIADDWPSISNHFRTTEGQIRGGYSADSGVRPVLNQMAPGFNAPEGEHRIALRKWNGINKWCVGYC
jgi:hypothetical protein